MKETAMRVIGVNDEQTHCDKCGRVELRGTVIIADSEGQEVGRYGTTCAAAVMNCKPAKVTAAKKAALSKRDRITRERDHIAAALNDDAKVAAWAERGTLDRETARLAELNNILETTTTWELAA